MIHTYFNIQKKENARFIIHNTQIQTTILQHMNFLNGPISIRNKFKASNCGGFFIVSLIIFFNLSYKWIFHSFNPFRPNTFTNSIMSWIVSDIKILPYFHTFFLFYVLTVILPVWYNSIINSNMEGCGCPQPCLSRNKCVKKWGGLFLFCSWAFRNPCLPPLLTQGRLRFSSSPHLFTPLAIGSTKSCLSIFISSVFLYPSIFNQAWNIVRLVWG